jgi:hypothetical protein
MSIITVDQLKTYLDISSANSDQDTLLGYLTSAAESFVQLYTGNAFSSATTSAYFDGAGTNEIIISSPILSLSSLKKGATRAVVDDTTTSALTHVTDYVFYPQSGRVRLVGDAVFPFGYQNVYAEYTYGYGSVPPQILEVTLEIAAIAYYEARKGRLGLLSKNQDSKSSMMQEFVRGALPAKTKAMLDMYSNPLGQQEGVPL